MRKPVLIASLIVAGLAGQPGFAQRVPGSDIPAQAGRQTMPLTHIARGTVKHVDAAQRAVTVAHAAVASLNWPPMTMQFNYREPVTADMLAVGEAITFNFVQSGGDYVITAVQPGVGPVAPSPGKDKEDHAMGDMQGQGMGQMKGMGGMMDMCGGMMSSMMGGKGARRER